MNPQKAPSCTKVVLLGTGTPIADPLRSGPSVAVVVDQSPYIIDFGPGVVRRAAAAFQAGVEGLAVQHLTRAFCTHLHSDHTAGYPDLIFTPGVLGRSEPLCVYGPGGLRHMTDHIMAAYQEDLRVRIEGLEPSDPNGYTVNVHEIKPGLIYEDENVVVDAFCVRHGPWPAFGFKFTTPDRSIVISGDTTPVEIMVEKAKGCDILIHEVYSAETLKKRSADWQTYHTNMHTSSQELARIAGQAKPELLVLYHQLYWGCSDEDLIKEVKSHYCGEVVSGKDLDTF
ncbi:MAG: MBL fold metallo-hydrolase [Anaerolineaceae bacterium]|nr:MBL fold metallo-hydrolase [Anaerolineaceae bacterium]